MDRHEHIFSRIKTLLLQYLELFGQVRIGVYRLNDIPRCRFRQFLESARTSLVRGNLYPLYIWIYDEGRREYLLLLLSSNFFRTDMKDATYLLERVWRLYSPLPVQFQTSYEVFPHNGPDVLERLKHITESWCMVQPSFTRYLHSFGTSMDPICTS